MIIMRKRKKRLQRFAIGGGAFLVGVVCSYALVQTVINPPKKASPQTQTTKTTTPVQTKKDLVRLVAMGDLLAHDSVVQNARQPGSEYDFTKFFKPISPLYKDADITFCNPETPAGTRLGVSGYPTFNAPDEFVRDLRKDPGCNLINLATNHINDK